MTVPGYPPRAPELAFSEADRPDLVIREPLGEWAVLASAETDRRIASWREVVSAALHAEFHAVVEASAEQLNVLATLLTDAGFDVDAASWQQELTVAEASFAWASASESCVLALLDWAADTEGVFYEELIGKYATAKLDANEFLRASGLPSSHHEYALAVAWTAIAPTIANVPLLYRGRSFVVTRRPPEIVLSHGRPDTESDPSRQGQARP